MTGKIKKIVLSGAASVGKTSLVNQYVRQRFLDKYPSIIGVRIDRKEMHIRDFVLDMIIWDLASESSQKNIPQAYLIKAEGVIYVVDISDPSTFVQMEDDIAFLKAKLLDIPILIVANKSDKVNEDEIQGIIAGMPIRPDFIASAKNSLNIREIFDRLGELMLN